jgi:DHA1 family bicyclomycin/chloramphenicol resistance-like MFS transporter
MSKVGIMDKEIKKSFIILMAFFMSLMALAIDAMLPAINVIRNDFNIQNPNDAQLVVSSIFLGMSAGLMIYGPISDSIGRKKPLYFGLCFFITGCFISLFSTTLEIMLVGRFLQGFGCAACRVISVAMIRDNFSGAKMGKIMSVVMMFFILVPALAPALGQLILYVASWRYIFAFFIVLAFFGLYALKFKQEETLSKENVKEFSFSNILDGIKETLANKVSRTYTIAAGLTFGAFITYLSTVQQIFSDLYGVEESFSLYFGSLAIFIGLSSFINAKFVEKFGMSNLSNFAFIALSLLSLIYLIILWLSGGQTNIVTFYIYLALSFLVIGILFGNLNTLAIDPLGHIAGVANSVISALQTFISVIIGVVVGQMYNESAYSLVIAFFLLSAVSYLLIRFSINSENK